ncbi:hypothetical protein JVU11DRAFT_3241 [Chiua virens]|nr:hypothetical protein JVU11DRAFT_3241 [Chiua virens]
MSICTLPGEYGYVITQKVWIVVLMCVISISRTGVSIAAAVLGILEPTWQSYFDTSGKLLVVGNMLFIIGDIFSACAMAYHLNRFKSWTATYQPTRSRDPRRIDLLLNRLIMFSVSTGALTVVVDVIALALSTPTRSSHHLTFEMSPASTYDNPPSTAIELHAAVSLQFARRSDLTTISEEGYVPVAHVGDTSKSDIESWQTSQAQSRTSPQI